LRESLSLLINVNIGDEMTIKEITRKNIQEMTRIFLNKGNQIKKIPSSKTQESYVRNTHHSISGRIGWFEVG